jgi:hypothetical protein
MCTWFIYGIIAAANSSVIAIGIILLILSFVVFVFSIYICCTLKRRIQEGTLRKIACVWIIFRTVLFALYAILYIVILIIIIVVLASVSSAASSTGNA